MVQKSKTQTTGQKVKQDTKVKRLITIDMNHTNSRALFGGLVAAIIIAVAIYLLGDVSGYKAKELIKSSLPGINVLCNTVVLASATILALLLTLLGISSSSETKLTKGHYYQVLFIARMDTILFVVAIILFQIFNIPITEADTLPVGWYIYAYWATLIFSSLLSGALVCVILLLYLTVNNIIQIVGLGKDDHEMIYTDTEE